MALRHNDIFLRLALLLILTSLLGTFGIASAAKPDSYVVDLTGMNGADHFTGDHHATPIGGEAGVQILFDGADPYCNLPLPTAGIDCTEYPYLALLVRTNYAAKKGELRFTTTNTGGDFPCQDITYQDTYDWQVVVCHLTNENSVKYTSQKDFTGNYTVLRLDMYDNDCPAETVYEIRAFGFYKTAEDAASLKDFAPSGDTAPTLSILSDTTDYSAHPLGEAFANPALDKRMRWVTSGYFNFPSHMYLYLQRGYGGVVSNVPFTPTYLQDDAEFLILKEYFDTADFLGMNTWIYDEYQWPSGKAFGLVLKDHEELEARGILKKTIRGQNRDAEYAIRGTELAIVEAYLTDDNGTTKLEITDPARIQAKTSGSWTMDVYVLRFTFDGKEDPTDFTTLRDVDLLNKDAVARFIEVTYQAYKDKLGSTFDTVQGFFTDEPQLGNRGMTSYAVWTEGLADRFEKTYGYPLNLPSIYAGNTDYDRIIRMNYYQLVADLFKESYVDQITAWCEANGTASSGHFLFEEDMNDQIETYGGDFLQFVGGMTIPGADTLWVEPTRLMSQGNIGDYMGLRYVSSAAKNGGKWNAFLEYNPDAAGTLPENGYAHSIGGAAICRYLGLNVFHVINPQDSYTTEESHGLNVYVGRLNTLLDGARETGEVALFYPIATVQALHNADSDHSSTSGGRKTEASKLNAKFEDLGKKLLTAQHPFTVIDDESICAGSITADGKLQIGLGSYRVVILAYSQYVSVEALTKLADFCDAGGTVIFVGDKPAHGYRLEQEDEIAALMARLSDQPAVPESQTDISDILDSLVTRSMALDATSSVKRSILMADYASDTADMTFLVNTSGRTLSMKLSYTDGYTGTTSVYYPSSGVIESVTFSNKQEITIPGYDSVIILRQTSSAPAETESGTETEPVTEAVTETEPATEATAETAGEVDGDKSVFPLPLAAAIGAVAVAIAGLTVWLTHRRK